MEILLNEFSHDDTAKVKVSETYDGTKYIMFETPRGEMEFKLDELKKAIAALE